MLNRLNKFLDKYKIINQSQHGFRKGLSTTTAAFEYLEKIYELLDKKVKPRGAFIDLSKAFDF
jgi:hypothetical protein